MDKNLVKDWMTKNPVLIKPTDTLPDAHKLMTAKRVRRLPVVDGDKLIGIVTLGDVREAEPSNATSLSIFELNYLLAKLPVADIMTCNPIIVHPDMPITEAAELMLQYKIGGIPVVKNGDLLGIITESDIFRAFVKLVEPKATKELSPA